MKDRIPGGYYIKARVIKNKRIAHSPPHFREIWEYLLREANHKAVQYGRYLVERGQLFRTYKEIRDDLCWFAGYRKVTYSENQTKKAMMALREYQMIATKKEPGGVLITVLNYDFYQDPSNYEGTNESTNGSTNGGTNKEPSLNANNKNEKNVKKEEIIKAVIDFFNFTTGKKFSHKNKEINKLISGRTNDGFSVEDFKTVILTKFT
ncbi:MAG: hypothetical protein HN580_00995, partial [Deltaproteobacteria bacterium]|nr:hypothetical protein [Deltaproteobacteria bacterium]